MRAVHFVLGSLVVVFAVYAKNVECTNDYSTLSLYGELPTRGIRPILLIILVEIAGRIQTVRTQVTLFIENDDVWNDADYKSDLRGYSSNMNYFRQLKFSMGILVGLVKLYFRSYPYFAAHINAHGATGLEAEAMSALENLGRLCNAITSAAPSHKLLVYERIGRISGVSAAVIEAVAARVA